MIDKKEIETVIKILKKEYLPSKLALNKFKEPYQVLISCILSLRTKDEVTEKASQRLFGVAKTPEEMIKIDDEVIKKAIYPVGFYNRKAVTIKEISRVLIGKYNCKVPDKIEELLKLKGVGRKTANIVLTQGFGKPALPIDTHCHRIPNRLGWIKTKNPEQTEIELTKIIPKEHWLVFNQVFVRHGQVICTPISPWCSRCAVEKYCKKIGVKRHR